MAFPTLNLQAFQFIAPAHWVQMVMLQQQSFQWIFRTDFLQYCCWSWSSSILATWCKELTHLKRPWCWERLKAGGEVDDRGWDGWIASLTWWTWVWVGSRSWWWREVCHAAVHGLQRVGHDWGTELNWTELLINISLLLYYLSIQKESYSGYVEATMCSLQRNQRNRK